MITLKDWLETVNYRITEGTKYCWNCFGPNAHTLDSWDGSHEGASSNVVMDTATQTVYQVEVHDYARDRSYRWFNPDYRAAYNDEARDRGVDPDESYDGVKFIELETPQDFMEKCRAIMNYQDYDTRVEVPVDIPDSELFALMKIAHERDITFNQLVEEVLKQTIEHYESKETNSKESR